MTGYCQKKIRIQNVNYFHVNVHVEYYDILFWKELKYSQYQEQNPESQNYIN